MKWLPVPSVPRWLMRCGWFSLGYFCTTRSKRSCRMPHASTVDTGALAQAPRSFLPPLSVRPCGTAFSIDSRMPNKLSGKCEAFRLVFTAIMPQPISTPTAAGMIAPLVGITLPTVAPIPQWTSGIAATHL